MKKVSFIRVFFELSIVYLENLVKTTNISLVIPTTTSSICVTQSPDRIRRVLAPLASSETFSDVASIYHDEQQSRKDGPTNGISNAEKKSKRTIKNTDFDSLEILFDFSSTDLENDSDTNVVQAPENPCRIRFSENTQIINATKV
jgi:hypothetical protein